MTLGAPPSVRDELERLPVTVNATTSALLGKSIISCTLGYRPLQILHGVTVHNRSPLHLGNRTHTTQGSRVEVKSIASRRTPAHITREGSREQACICTNDDTTSGRSGRRDRHVRSTPDARQHTHRRYRQLVSIIVHNASIGGRPRCQIAARVDGWRGEVSGRHERAPR
ncbi:hypothetical protein BD310DRAFT_281197 [Dichomitus squalens]|uniref:Uncharacterized protein n=1 Tax=Dichomitus squalens TaxID=114155 RepID=A0A4V2K9P5_9APHY|nr:hypothetical protein BD310DRAFT_281197 [Dichomitus squalens]